MTIGKILFKTYGGDINIYQSSSKKESGKNHWEESKEYRTSAINNFFY